MGYAGQIEDNESLPESEGKRHGLSVSKVQK